ncbi:MAG: alpha-amylase [Chloroflexi bacterium]|nr:alpha-amylase [Chloroflexota bacterium]
MEFHISRKARDRYEFDQSLFELNGNVIFANFHAVRLFTQRINQKRDLVNYPETAVKAGNINAMGLIDEILHFVIALYRQQKNPQAMRQALQFIESAVGAEQLDRVLLYFASEFPAVAVYQRQLTPKAYLEGETDGVPNREIVLEEMIMLWVTNRNPAISPYLELFDDSDLSVNTAYRQVMESANEFFNAQPAFGPENQHLIQLLRSPAIAVPHSLPGQLEYIRERWSIFLGKYLYRLLSSLDLIREEEKMRFFGPGEVPVPIYDLSMQEDAERFSPDREWMPRLVMLAKNTYVWLSQLSRQYKEDINRLDQVPDEELDRLARAGFTGLWLIGLWERSHASASIKRMCGNPEAIASAYSLKNYEIAYDLGGEEAYQNLRDRAWQRGIRLASDMVPNHMGIDSNWVADHPDWFVQLDYSPFPSYSYNGPNLSSDDRVTIQLEDHYFNRTDAAVVFRLIENHTGRHRFIYHGNDGTSMPWNDTAQLNYLIPAVREAVIQTILHVARKFPIIRFDAAMTLAKKHYQRLWFPEPGSGGDIPSRAEYGLTKEQFDQAFPQEFWREVVDRVAVETPDTLLLAEAFWLMEGYFVRTLGMHRVYNSAFMNMLRDEKNAEYRQLIKNTLEFDPQILRRYVNFMNNPDERTAIDQFGDGDKYFGICALMSTLPGLPMFGHGQIEGYAEKYGMEFKRDYWNEPVKDYLMERHQREIFPILHRRAQFADVENFNLFDFFTTGGGVDENVYAYTNGQGDSRSLVVYNNSYNSTQGWIRLSAAVSIKQDGSDQRRLVQRSLVEGLNLQPQAGRYVILRDSAHHLEYIRPSQELAQNGLYLELDGYKYLVFMDITEVQDDAAQSYRHLCEFLNGRGVPSIEEALQSMLLKAVQIPYREIAHPAYLQYLLDQRAAGLLEENRLALINEAVEKQSRLLKGIQTHTAETNGYPESLNQLAREMEVILSLDKLEALYPLPGAKKYQAALKLVQTRLKDEKYWKILFGWLFVNHLADLSPQLPNNTLCLSRFDEWQFGKMLASAYQQMGEEESAAWAMVARVRLLILLSGWNLDPADQTAAQAVKAWLAEEDIRRFLDVNRFKEVLWFNKEAYEEWCWWLLALKAIQNAANPQVDANRFVEEIVKTSLFIQQLLDAKNQSGFQVAGLIEALEQTGE